MISFYPGPSKLDPAVGQAMADAVQSGILSVNHRSEEFVEVCQKAVSALREKLEIPESYQIVFTSSATECWEIIAQSLTEKGGLHLYNGAFGEKWFRYAQKIRPSSVGHSFDFNQQIDLNGIRAPFQPELVCLTHSETSNGTLVPNSSMSAIRAKYPDSLIAVDAVSSMAGVQLAWEVADIWFASVQKCLGLPAGLGIMVISPSAISKTKALGEWDHYNSLAFMIEKMEVCQTTYTPNVLEIWLLGQVIKARMSITELAPILEKRAENLRALIRRLPNFELLVENQAVASPTVIAVRPTGEVSATELRQRAKEAGFLLGKGYGTLGEGTFRIANFPAHTDREMKDLAEFLESQ